LFKGTSGSIVVLLLLFMKINLPYNYYFWGKEAFKSEVAAFRIKKVILMKPVFLVLHYRRH
jgi:hypothetical protein